MKKKKLTSAQKFHRRLVAQRKKDRFFEHDTRSETSEEGKSSVFDIQDIKSAIELPNNNDIGHGKKIKNKNYWRQVKLLKKQKQLTLINNSTIKGNCCCHCACSDISIFQPHSHPQLNKTTAISYKFLQTKNKRNGKVLQLNEKKSVNDHLRQFHGVGNCMHTMQSVIRCGIKFNFLILITIYL